MTNAPPIAAIIASGDIFTARYQTEIGTSDFSTMITATKWLHFSCEQA
jgi:hypothetical protein